MEVIFSEEFKKEYRKIKDPNIRERILKQIEKLEQYPESGKPLRYDLKKYRSIRIPPFRLIYFLEDNKIMIIAFEHRKEAYEE